MMKERTKKEKKTELWNKENGEKDIIKFEEVASLFFSPTENMDVSSAPISVLVVNER